MKTFPVLVLPSQIVLIQNSQMPVDGRPVEPKRPNSNKPTELKFSFVDLFIKGVCIFTLFGCIYGIAVGKTESIGFLIVLILFTSLYLIVPVITRVNAETDWADYESRLKDYEQKMKEYNQKLKELQTEASIKAWKHKQIIEILKSQTTLPKHYRRDSNSKGRLENIFLGRLKDWFGDYIYTGLIINNFVDKEPYQPDYIFIDTNTNLHIDIEIDEPYVSHNKQPIHYWSGEYYVDKDRNSYFIKHNWIVIRFAEEQIVKYPDECCKYIAKIVSELISNNQFLQKMNAVSYLLEVNHWTYEEAKEMAINNYRDKYIASKLKETEDEYERELKRHGLSMPKGQKWQNLTIEQARKSMEIAKKYGRA
ncbi:hypothetical protein GXP67_08635 [Rhodocytophaga rosea]|uniref:DUF559 domain-containing protein n=1 Tax=Rhodocytophaga rosea TaxID=2704465 RepID=A0A6C0GGB4_9BACT|nr:hypothetical protein [Rhodocytophaga rosea]QHT66720.1 hypothetical protein GXP67_08635 [Rhodocytophaga rosea]